MTRDLGVWTVYDCTLVPMRVGRLGRPDEAAHVALFPASDESSDVTGVDIIIDGGMKVR